jgi:hypothetical protein
MHRFSRERLRKPILGKINILFCTCTFQQQEIYPFSCPGMLLSELNTLYVTLNAFRSWTKRKYVILLLCNGGYHSDYLIPPPALSYLHRPTATVCVRPLFCECGIYNIGSSFSTASDSVWPRTTRPARHGPGVQIFVSSSPTDLPFSRGELVIIQISCAFLSSVRNRRPLDCLFISLVIL